VGRKLVGLVEGGQKRRLVDVSVLRLSSSSVALPSPVQREDEEGQEGGVVFD
jgi:hypothetical protein